MGKLMIKFKINNDFDFLKYNEQSYIYILTEKQYDLIASFIADDNVVPQLTWACLDGMFNGYAFLDYIDIYDIRKLKNISIDILKQKFYVNDKVGEKFVWLYFNDNQNNNITPGIILDFSNIDAMELLNRVVMSIITAATDNADYWGGLQSVSKL